VHRADNLAASCADCLEILGVSICRSPTGLSRFVIGVALPLRCNWEIHRSAVEKRRGNVVDTN
jgi:hypothetical protein